ncbi:hypothetical protein Hanom_Chr02g00133401 [Helianthus anomalus]
MAHTLQWSPFAPINIVKAYVIAIAIQPPTTTLMVDLTVGARPNAAPNHPKTASATVTAAATTKSLTL